MNPYGLPPASVDLGHETRPEQLSNTMQEKMFGLINGIGGELRMTSRLEPSRRNGMIVNTNTSWDDGSDYIQVGKAIERQMQPEMQNMYYYNNPNYAMPTQMRMLPQPQPQQQNTRKLMNEIDISQYIGETSTASIVNAETSPIEVSFSNALQPVEMKLEAVCKILGKLYQLQVEHNNIMQNYLRSMSAEIITATKANLETLINANESIPSMEQYEDETYEEQNEVPEDVEVVEEEEEEVEVVPPRKNKAK